MAFLHSESLLAYKEPEETRISPQYHFFLPAMKMAGWAVILRGKSQGIGIISFICVPRIKALAQRSLILAEWIKHNEMILIKILADHLLQSHEGAGLTLSSGGARSLEFL